MADGANLRIGPVTDVRSPEEVRTDSRTSDGQRASRGAALLVLSAIVAVALNQRPAVVSTGLVLGDLRADTGLSSAMAGLLTAAPVLCFGLFAPLAPWLARRLGPEIAVAAALLLLAAGIALRLLSPVALLYAGTVLAGAAIAVTNVLMPAHVKAEFVRPGAVMGLYTASLNVGAATAAAVTVPLAAALHVAWRAALGLWLVLALVALALWLPVACRRGGRRLVQEASAGGSWSLLRQPLARHVTAFLGFQSVQFYSFIAWLPTLLADAGVSVHAGGLLLALSNVVGAGVALVIPGIAGRMRTQRPLLVGIMAFFVIGLTGLLVAPGSGTWLWVSVFGIAQGGGFALALAMIVLRSATPLTAARLGGVAQCLGYSLAAAGPFALGAIHDVTGTWTWPVALLLVLLIPMTWVGWGAARDAVLGSDARTGGARLRKT